MVWVGDLCRPGDGLLMVGLMKKLVSIGWLVDFSRCQPRKINQQHGFLRTGLILDNLGLDSLTGVRCL
jgi:hypothetical protein